MSNLFGFSWLFRSQDAEDDESSLDLSSSQMELDESATFATPPSVPPPPKDKIKKTIPELLVQILPDVDIHAPNVLMLGEQSSGKTRMIISLLFYYIIDHPLFTADMGELLLKLFKTGNSMVTRRPTTVRFLHAVSNSGLSTSSSSSQPNDTLDISLTFEGQLVHYHSQTESFRQLIEQLSVHPLADALFEAEVVITIRAHNVPNITFTDFPGLTTDDRTFSDSGRSLKGLIKEKMRQTHNTLVIVEPSSREDLNTSHICPLLESCRITSRPEIFDNSVLVLTKCDKLAQSTFAKDTQPLVLRTSPTIQQFPFRYIVAVINKSEQDKYDEWQDIQRFDEFKELFRLTRADEEKWFNNFPALQHDTHVTTKAVFTAMDRIFYQNFAVSIENGLVNIQRVIQEHEVAMKSQSAPPPHIYHHYGQGVAISSYEGIDIRSIYSDFFDRIGSMMTRLIDAFVIAPPPFIPQEKWSPNIHSSGKVNYLLFAAQKEIFETEVKPYAQRLIDSLLEYIALSTDQTLLQPANSSFHRIDRFPALQERIRSSLLKESHLWKNHLYEIAYAYLNGVWQREEPVGQMQSYARLQRLLQQEIPHIVVSNAYYDIIQSWKTIEIDWTNAISLLAEEESFRAMREKMDGRYADLKRQEWILQLCRGATSDDDLKKQLMQGSRQLHEQLTQAGLMKSFWNSLYFETFPQHQQDQALLFHLYQQRLVIENQQLMTSPSLASNVALISTAAVDVVPLQPLLSPLSSPIKSAVKMMETDDVLSPILPTINQKDNTPKKVSDDDIDDGGLTPSFQTTGKRREREEDEVEANKIHHTSNNGGGFIDSPFRDEDETYIEREEAYYTAAQFQPSSVLPTSEQSSKRLKIEDGGHYVKSGVVIRGYEEVKKEKEEGNGEVSSEEMDEDDKGWLDATNHSLGNSRTPSKIASSTIPGNSANKINPITSAPSSALSSQGSGKKVLPVQTLNRSSDLGVSKNLLADSPPPKPPKPTTTSAVPPTTSALTSSNYTPSHSKYGFSKSFTTSAAPASSKAGQYLSMSQPAPGTKSTSYIKSSTSRAPVVDLSQDDADDKDDDEFLQSQFFT